MSAYEAHSHRSTASGSAGRPCNGQTGRAISISDDVSYFIFLSELSGCSFSGYDVRLGREAERRASVVQRYYKYSRFRDWRRLARKH